MNSDFTVEDFITCPGSVPFDKFSSFLNQIKSDQISLIQKNLPTLQDVLQTAPLGLEQYEKLAFEFHDEEANEAVNKLHLIEDIDYLVTKKHCLLRNSIRCENGTDNFRISVSYPSPEITKERFCEDYEDFRAGEYVMLRQVFPCMKIEILAKIYEFEETGFKLVLNSLEIGEYRDLLLNPELHSKVYYPPNSKSFQPFRPDIILMPKRNILDSYLILGERLRRDKFTNQSRNFDLQSLLLQETRFVQPQINEFPKIAFIDQSLNNEQRYAVKNAILAPNLFVIDGPPGTGKTRVLAEIALQLAVMGKKVLVTAPSPAALENINNRICDAQRVISCHVGCKEKETVIGSNHIDVLVMQNKRYKEAEMNTNKYIKLKREPDTSPEDAQFLSDTLTKMKKSQSEISIELKKIILGMSKIVCATLPDLTDNLFEKNNIFFDVVILDECSQAAEIESWIAVMKGKKLVIAGDEHQLKCYVASKKLRNEQKHLSLFSRVKRMIPDVYFNDELIKMPEMYQFLRVQYRMNSDIMEWSNLSFYNGLIKSDESCANISLDPKRKPGNKSKSPRLVLINIEGLGYFDETDPFKSKYNLYEAAYALEMVKYLFNNFNLTTDDIGIISTYKAQMELISNSLKSIPNASLIKNWTIDGFQGKEKEVIILSMVRSNSGQDAGFIDENKLNVAVTRAKSMLVVICNTDTMSKNEGKLKTLMTHLKRKATIFNQFVIHKSQSLDLVRSNSNFKSEHKIPMTAPRDPDIEQASLKTTSHNFSQRQTSNTRGQNLVRFNYNKKTSNSGRINAYSGDFQVENLLSSGASRQKEVNPKKESSGCSYEQASNYKPYRNFKTESRNRFDSNTSSRASVNSNANDSVEIPDNESSKPEERKIEEYPSETQKSKQRGIYSERKSSDISSGSDDLRTSKLQPKGQSNQAPLNSFNSIISQSTRESVNSNVNYREETPEIESSKPEERKIGEVPSETNKKKKIKWVPISIESLSSKPNTSADSNKTSMKSTMSQNDKGWGNPLKKR